MEEIARVIEGSVENLIPFGADKTGVVKKESATPKIDDTETGLPLVDWFGMVLTPDISNTSTEVPVEVETTSIIPNLGWLQMVLNHQRIMNQQQVQPSNVEDEFKPVESSNFDSKYQQWQAAKNLATNWFEPEPQKADQYSVAKKSKFSWSKMLAEPLDNYKQYIPLDNAVQWSSNEVTSNDMIDIGQKQEMMPPVFVKNKEQWFGESEI